MKRPAPTGAGLATSGYATKQVRREALPPARGILGRLRDPCLQPQQARTSLRTMKLMSVSELRRYSKETHGHDHATDEEAFLDAYRYGAYHEDRVNWDRVAQRLSKDELADAWKAICHMLIAGSIENRDGANLKKLMELQEAIARWQDTALKSPEDLYGPLEAVGNLVVAELPQGGYWRQIAIYFLILNSGIRQRAGVHPIYFDGAVKKLERMLDDGGKQ